MWEVHLERVKFKVLVEACNLVAGNKYLCQLKKTTIAEDTKLDDLFTACSPNLASNHPMRKMSLKRRSTSSFKFTKTPESSKHFSALSWTVSY